MVTTSAGLALRAALTGECLQTAVAAIRLSGCACATFASVLDVL